MVSRQGEFTPLGKVEAALQPLPILIAITQQPPISYNQHSVTLERRSLLPAPKVEGAEPL